MIVCCLLMRALGPPAGVAFAARRASTETPSLTARRAGKSPEEIRKTFNIKNDFTPVRRWSFRGLTAFVGAVEVPTAVLPRT